MNIANTLRRTGRWLTDAGEWVLIECAFLMVGRLDDWKHSNLNNNELQD